MARTKNDLILEVLNELMGEGNAKLLAKRNQMEQTLLQTTLASKAVQKLATRRASLQSTYDELTKQRDDIRRQLSDIAEELKTKHGVEWASRSTYGRYRSEEDLLLDKSGLEFIQTPASIVAWHQQAQQKLATVHQNAKLHIASSRAPELAMIAQMVREEIEKIDG